MLRIRSVRLNSNGLRAEALDVLDLALIGRRQRRGLDLDQSLGKLPPDTDSDDGVRQVAAVEDCVWDIVSRISLQHSYGMGHVRGQIWMPFQRQETVVKYGNAGIRPLLYSGRVGHQ